MRVSRSLDRQLFRFRDPSASLRCSHELVWRESSSASIPMVVRNGDRYGDDETPHGEVRAGRPRILYVAANPDGRLALDQEYATIIRELELAPYRDFEVTPVLAATVEDLQRYLNKPGLVILHFAGHGRAGPRIADPPDGPWRDIVSLNEEEERAGIYVLGERGQPQLLTARALARMIRSAAPSLRIVVANTCYSDALAAELREVVDCVIGMTDAISDEAALVFAAALYRALGNRRSVGNACAQAVDALAARQLLGQEPRCRPRAAVDADRLFLPHPSSPLEPHRLDTGRYRRIAQYEVLIGCLVGFAFALALVTAAVALVSHIESDRHAWPAQDASPTDPDAPDPHPGHTERTTPPPQASTAQPEARQLLTPTASTPQLPAPGEQTQPYRHEPVPPRIAPPARATRPSATPRPSAIAPRPAKAPGQLDRETVQRYIRLRRAQIKHCYETQLAVVPTLAGTVMVQFGISPEGKVASSTATGLDEEVSSCVADVIQSIEFPRSDASLHVRYPFHFVPADE